MQIIHFQGPLHQKALEVMNSPPPKTMLCFVNKTLWHSMAIYLQLKGYELENGTTLFEEEGGEKERKVLN